MKEEITDFLRDRFAQQSNGTYISLTVIFSLLTILKNDLSLFKLGLFIFLLILIVSNSVYILIQKDKSESIVDSKGNIKSIAIKTYPGLKTLSKVGLLLSGVMLVSLISLPDFRIIAVPANTATPTNTNSPTATSTITLTPTSFVSDTPTETSTPTITPTFTLTPTFTPSLTATATTNPMVFRGLDQQCLSQNLWAPYFYTGDDKVVDSRNCWDFGGWGIFPMVRGLKFDVTDASVRQDITRRFYTEINGDAEIKFSVKIERFTTKQDFDGVLMLGVGNPESVLYSGYFIKYSVLGKDKKIYRSVSPNIKIYFEPRSGYSLEEKQNIIIRITGDQVKIIADGILLGTMKLSAADHSVFWVVYSLPSNNGSLNAEISDIQIYDHR